MNHQGNLLAAGAFNGFQGPSIASAHAIDLNNTTNQVVITGNTTIDIVALSDGRTRTALFTGACPLINSAGLQVMGGANYTTEVNTVIEFIALSGVVYASILNKTPPVTPFGQKYLSQTFTAQTSINVVHNFGVQPLVDILDSAQVVLTALQITHNTVNDFTVTFSTARTGTIIASATGLLSSAFTAQTSVNIVHNYKSFPAVAAINASGLKIFPLEITHNTVNDFTVTFSVLGSGTIIYSNATTYLHVFSGQPLININHNLQKYPVVTAIDSSNKVVSPDTITHSTVNTLIEQFSASSTGTSLLTT